MYLLASRITRHMNLYNYFLTQKGPRIIKNAHYFAIYEKYFAQYVNKSLLFLEIGTGNGGSALMWKRYFGPMARIVTLDIQDRRYIETDQIFTRTGDQSDPAVLTGIINEFGPPDIVLDDGSLMMPHINSTFNILFPLMNSRGIYLVEDLNTAYWPQNGGGYLAPASFIERCKGLVDELHARYSQGAVAETEFSRTAFSVCFYEMMVVIEKAPYINRTLLYLPEPEEYGAKERAVETR
jgi:cephalosporin hydroxylase